VSYRQSAVGWPTLEFESLNEALSAVTIVTAMCLATLAFRFWHASIIILLARPYVLLLGLVPIRLRLVPCTSLVGLWVRCLASTISPMILGSRAMMSA